MARTRFPNALQTGSCVLAFSIALGCRSDATGPARGIDDLTGPRYSHSGDGVPHSGEEVFRGLFFGDGDVGAQFPEFFEGHTADSWATNSTELDYIATMKSDIVAKINSTDAGFLARFGDGVQSGDHLRVEAYLDTAANHLDQAFSAFVLESRASYIAAHPEGQGVPELTDQTETGFAVRYDTVIVDNGETMTAVGAGTVAVEFVAFFRALAANQALAVNRMSFVNSMVALNRYTIANRNWIMNKNRFRELPRIQSLGTTYGSSDLSSEYVVDVVTTRLSPSPSEPCPPPQVIC